MTDLMQQIRELVETELKHAGLRGVAPLLRDIITALRAAPEGFVLVPVQTLESIRDSSTDPVARGFAAGTLAACLRTTPEKPQVSATTQRLIDLLIERDRAGRAKYGTTLDRTDLSTKDWLQHQVEELLDGAGYALAAIRTLEGKE